MLSKEGIEKTFGRKFSEKFNIHRTRGNFANNGIDTFSDMAKRGVLIVDRVVQEEMKGTVDLEKGQWYIPNASAQVEPAQ